MTLRRGADAVAMLARLTRDLPRFLRRPMTLEDARTLIARRLETRPEQLLRVAEAIYAHARSPYLWLLRNAGCELEDLSALVRHEGVEGALRTLASRGVYVTADEFTCRRAIVRGSARLAPTMSDFDNPNVPAHLERWTSGSRSQRTPVRVGLAHVSAVAANHAVALHAHGLNDVDHAVWLTGPFIFLLVFAKLGHPPLAWFHHLHPLPWKARAAGWYLEGISRLAGCPVPGPTWVDLQDADRLVRWLRERVAAGRRVCLTTYASSAVRVAAAAGERGLSLEGVHFMAMGEPFTPAKQRAIHAVGARALVRYGFVEFTFAACGCASPQGVDDQHLFTDGLAIIPHRREGPGASLELFQFTTLLPDAPKIMLNAENGDHGRIERRSCDCPLGSLGLTDHVSGIGSDEKLTGEGMNFASTDLVRILEEVLPERFGGSSVDYQIVEEEDRRGIVRLYLLAGPRVGPLDEVALKGVFLCELGRGGELERYMARMWERARTIEVKREAPRVGPTGKVLFYHLARSEADRRIGLPDESAPA